MMDLRSSDDIGGVKIPKKMDIQEAGRNSKVMGTGSVSNKEMMFRADKIDLKSLDLQLEKHLSKVWTSRNSDAQKPIEEWEIDLSKLVIRYLIAHGTYGTVYRGTYDNQDVAEKYFFWHCMFVNYAPDDFTHCTFHLDANVFQLDANVVSLEYYSFGCGLVGCGGVLVVVLIIGERKVILVKLLDWGEDGMTTSAQNAALRASFRQEVAVWHKLDHPNVTKFVGASMGTSNLKLPSTNSSNDDNNSLHSRACCVVVEYLPGGTLKQYLIRNRRKKLAFKVVIQLALDLSRGLSYLHTKKIVHRDVKTENMLIDAHRTLKIADFGVARVEAQNPRDMTGETGTLGYMAPEVLDGKPYNRRCDVYSFGICLWEIYCCDMPYPDLSFADVSSAVVRQNLRPDIPRCCPSSLASIMRKCWDANADKRPEMDEVVRMLEAIDTTKGGGMIPEDQASEDRMIHGIEVKVEIEAHVGSNQELKAIPA
uniref:non-specific serine/threonine protein kinase n=1 Tax=Fagus sylvatica TaxID=28930 RepID=A0A2N9F4N8_FAGSY